MRSKGRVCKMDEKGEDEERVRGGLGREGGVYDGLGWGGRGGREAAPASTAAASAATRREPRPPWPLKRNETSETLGFNFNRKE